MKNYWTLGQQGNFVVSFPTDGTVHPSLQLYYNHRSIRIGSALKNNRFAAGGAELILSGMWRNQVPLDIAGNQKGKSCHSQSEIIIWLWQVTDQQNTQTNKRKILRNRVMVTLDWEIVDGGLDSRTYLSGHKTFRIHKGDVRECKIKDGSIL